jgi:hypothetical protein
MDNNQQTPPVVNQQPIPPVLTGNIIFNTNPVNRNNGNTAIDVRDRLFHVLFYRLSMMYARSFSKSYRRVFEFITILMVCFLNCFFFSYL